MIELLGKIRRELGGVVVPFRGRFQHDGQQGCHRCLDQTVLYTYQCGILFWGQVTPCEMPIFVSEMPDTRTLTQILDSASNKSTLSENPNVGK